LVSDLIKQLLDAGVHFGHQTKRWNPKMAKYIFGARKGIYIIDLEKTSKALERACNHIEELAAKGDTILFVGTKRQAQEIVKAEATRCGMFYVTHRWLGGTLTNFQTIRKSIKRMQELEEMRSNGVASALTKKELAGIEKEIAKLQRNLGGIAGMGRLPRAVFVIDAKREEASVQEARRLGIEIIAMVDTNCDPELVHYPIPANDDAIRSVRLITGMIADRVMLGRQRFADAQQQIVAEAAARAAAAEAVAQAAETEEAVAVPDEVIEQVEETVVGQADDAPKKGSKRRVKSDIESESKRAARTSKAGA